MQPSLCPMWSETWRPVFSGCGSIDKGTYSLCSRIKAVCDHMSPNSVKSSAVKIPVESHNHFARRLIPLDDSTDNATCWTNFLKAGEVAINAVSAENMATFQLLGFVYCAHTDHTVLILAFSVIIIIIVTIIGFLKLDKYMYYLSSFLNVLCTIIDIVRKPVFRVSNHIWHKLYSHRGW